MVGRASTARPYGGALTSAVPPCRIAARATRKGRVAANLQRIPSALSGNSKESSASRAAKQGPRDRAATDQGGLRGGTARFAIPPGGCASFAAREKAPTPTQDKKEGNLCSSCTSFWR